MKYAVMAILAAVLGTAACAEKAGPPPRPLGGGQVHGDAAHGRVVVERWCVSCHLPGPTARESVPSLAQLRARADNTERYVRAFLMQPHQPMPPVSLSIQEIEDIIAYLRPQN